MKKVFLFAVVVFAIVSCGPKKVEQTVEEQDSLVNVDTLPAADSTKVDSSSVVKVDTVAVKK